jgi:hypothetical protein
MQKAKKPDGFVYWQYLLCYVDDILVLSHDPKEIMNKISGYVAFKDGSIQAPTSYLGATISKMTILDGNNEFPLKDVWTMSAQDYIKRAVEEVERGLKSDDAYLPKKVETPFSYGYRPELDFSPELCPEKTNYYQGLIGILRWIVELGRIDIIVPVTMLSRYLVSPREGHLQQAFRIFAYLKQCLSLMTVNLSSHQTISSLVIGEHIIQMPLTRFLLMHQPHWVIQYLQLVMWMRIMLVAKRHVGLIQEFSSTLIVHLYNGIRSVKIQLRLQLSVQNI